MHSPEVMQAFEQAAREGNYEVAAIQATFIVEADSKWFEPDGVTPINRFEPHAYPEKHWPNLGFKTEGVAPWRASLAVKPSERKRMYETAKRIDLEAAYRAASHAAPQIMGFNHKDAGYQSAGEMVRAMTGNKPEQVAAFSRLVRSWGLDTALRSHDWLTFAKRYNGTGRPHYYAAEIAKAYKKLAGKPSLVVLRMGDRGESVDSLQRYLRRQGYEVSRDGIFGKQTDDAVRFFQRDHGLKIDGIVGAKTWEKLMKATPVGMEQPLPEAQSTADPDQKAEGAGAGAGLIGGTGIVSAVTGLVTGTEGWAQYAVIAGAFIFFMAVLFLFRRQIAARFA